MGNHQGRAALHDLVQGRLNVPLGFGVEGRGGLVQNQQRRVLQQGPGDCQALTLAAGQQHAVLTDLGIEAFGQLVDEVFGVSIRSRRFNVGPWRAGQVAVGDVVGHGVAEQRDMLGHLGNVLTQVEQLVVFDLYAVEQDLAAFVVVETRDQAGQCGLAAAGTAHQRDHLPGLCGERDVLEHMALGAWVSEVQVTHFQTAADLVALDAAAIHFLLFVQLFENAFSTGHAFLDGRADFRQLADRLGQQPGQGDVRHHVTGRCVTTKVEHQEHQHRHGGVDHQLQQRGVDGPGAGHAQLLVGVALAGLEEAFLFVDFTAEAAHHAIALDGFRSHVGHIAHGHLDFLALLAEFLAGRADHHRNQRQDSDHHQRQAPVHEQQRGKQEDHRHAFTDHHLDGIGGRARHHGHVEGDARNQVPGVVVVKVAVGQRQQVVEQLHAQVMDQAQGYLGQQVVAQERTQALPGSDQNDQQRHGLQQFHVTQERYAGEQHGVRVG
ncbi:hypothetical protein [Pseudomonas sp. 22 E 5]|nr:hypothetical protein [Pseudomonas sp. 22 E 5]